MSYRARRRLLRIVVAGAVVVAIAVSAALFWNTAENIETFSGGEADIYVAPQPHTLSKSERAALVLVAQRFVESAVTRDHPERAYGIVGPNLRGGLTKKQWASGEIPVVPYPVGSARWKVEYSNSDGVGLLVMVYPTEKARLEPAVFSMSMVSVRRGEGEGRWLVNGWVPKGGSPSAIGSSSGSPGQALAGEEEEFERVSPKASVAWLIFPAILICLVLVVPLVFLVRERRVARRMRRYLDSRAS